MARILPRLPAQRDQTLIHTYMVNYQRDNQRPPTIAEISAYLRGHPQVLGEFPNYSQDSIHRHLKTMLAAGKVLWLVGGESRCYFAK